MSGRLKKILKLLTITLSLMAGLWFVREALAVSIDLTVSGGLGTQSLTVMISQIIQVVLGFLGVIALGLMLYAGFLWMTASGDEEKISRAKKILVNAAIGLAIILSAFAIVSFLINQLIEVTGGNQPGGPIGPVGPGPGGSNNFYVQWVNPANNATNVSLCTIIQAKFNLDIVQNSIDNNFTLKVNGTTQIIPGALSANGKYLTFNPTDDLPASTDFEAIIEGGPNGILGTVGGTNYYLNQDYTWEFRTGTTSDNTPPQVSLKYPEDGVDNVCLNTFIQVQFNEPMWVSTIDNQDSMDLWYGAGFSTQYNYGYDVDANSVSTYTFGLDQMPLQSNTDYQPILNSAVIMDVCGNNLDGDEDGTYEPGGVDDYLDSTSIPNEPNWNFITGETLECIPTITSINPSSGFYDDATYLTITGSDFGIAGDVKFNNNLLVYDEPICFAGALASPQTPNYSCLDDWTAGQIKIKIPADNGLSNGAITGPVSVAVGGYVSNSVNFTVQSPHISSLSPTSGGVGQFISLWGSNFDAYDQTTSKVYFFQGANVREAILPCGDQGWQGDHIVIAVPDNMSPGVWNIQVKTKNNKWSNVDSFEVNNNPPGPGLCYINPSSGVFDSPFDLSGVEFGAPQPSSQVMFGTEYPAPISGAWGDTLITGAKVPNLAPGIASVSVKVNNTYSNPLPYNVLTQTGNQFYISYLEPDNGPVGQYITIYGLGFGNVKGVQTVKFGDIEGDFDFPEACGNNFWTNTQIIVKVPPGAVDSDVKVCHVFTDPNSCTNGVSFDVTTDPPSPGICSIYPSQGTISPPTTVEIAGEPFNNVNVVNFSNINISPPFIEQTNEIIKVNVPDNAITGAVKVTDNGGRVSNPVNFEVLAGQVNQAPFQHFDWQFTTCEDCMIPTIVFNSNCATTLASPAPYPMSQNNFSDIDLTVKFNTDMENSTFGWGGSVKLKQCGNGDLPATCVNAGISNATFSFDNNTGGETVIINISDDLTPNTWYKMELTGNLANPEGYQLYNGQGYGTTSPTPPWWYFKTQVGGLQCTVNQAVVSPGAANKGLNQQVDYLSAAYNTNNCNLCNQSNYLWNWSLENNSQNYAEFITPDPNPNDNQKLAFTLAVTPPGNPVGVKAQTSYLNQGGQTVLLDDQSELYIGNGGVGSSCDLDPGTSQCEQNLNFCNLGLYCQPDTCTCQPIECDGVLNNNSCEPDNTICANISPALYCQDSTCLCQPVTYPVVIDYGPDCGQACSNTSIVANFNMPMDTNTLLNDNNVKVMGCVDPSCNSLTSEFQVGKAYNNADFQLILTPTGSVLPEGWYRVILMDDIMSTGSYPPGSNNPPDNLGGLNYSTIPGGDNNAYSWTFGVNGEICEVQTVIVSPNTRVFTNQSQSQQYTANPYTDGNCGNTPLNQNSFNWSWTADPATPLIINVPNQNNFQIPVNPAINGFEGSTYVRATCDQPQGPNVTNTGNNGLVIVNYQGPQVINQCVGNILSPTPANGREDVCINVAASARFNLAMDESSLSTIYMRSCGTGATFNSADCTASVANQKTFLKNQANVTNGFVAWPNNPLSINTWYQITIPITVKSANGIPMDQEYSWHFKTKNDSTSCQPNFIAVSPDESVVLNGATVDYNGYAMTAACDLILNTSYNWQWTSLNTNLATVNPTTQNNTTSTLTHVSASPTNVGETDIKAEITNVLPVLPPGLGHLIVTSNPEVEQPTVPPDNSTNVCRNTEISANFNQLMDQQSIGGNIIVQKKTVTTPENAQQLGCTFISQGYQGGGTSYNFYYKKFAKITDFINKFFNKLSLAFVNREFIIFNKALAQAMNVNTYWCPVGGTISLETILDVTVYKTKFSFTPYYPLNPNAIYQIEVKGGPDGVKNIYGYAMDGSFGNTDWDFTTGSNICTLNFVRVYANYVSESNNSDTWTFTTNIDDPADNASPTAPELNDADKYYTAKAYSVSGLPLIVMTGIYEWAWSWESDDTVVATVNTSNNFQQLVTAQNENGIANISATALVTVDPEYGTLGQEKTGSAVADVFICENPWFDQLNPPPELSGNYTFPNGYFNDVPTNFKFRYCRDAGDEGTSDDLPQMSFTPIFHPPPVITPPGGNEDYLLKEYIFWIYDLEPPENLTASQQTGFPRPILLNWEGVETAGVTYTIERSGSALFNVIQQTISNISATTYTDYVTGSPGTHYYYRVKAEYQNGFSSWSNIVSITITNIY